MNQAGIQKIINKGSGIAAKLLGAEYSIYRPANSTTSVGTVMVQLDSKFDYMSEQPNLYGHPIWAALCDRTSLQIGDLLKSDAGSYFIITMQALLPTAVVESNATVSISRPGEDQSPNPDYYGGNITGTGRSLISNWPASILQGAKGEADATGAIGSPRQPWAAILLPAIPGVTLKTSDILVDGTKRRWNISSCEVTGSGYRITAASANA